MADVKPPCMFWIEGLITIPKFVAKKRLSLELQQLIFVDVKTRYCSGKLLLNILKIEAGKDLQKLHTSSIKQFPAASILWHTSVAELNWRFSHQRFDFFFAVEQKTKKGLKFANCNNLLIILLPSLLEKFFQEKSSSSHNKNNNVCKSLVSIKFFVAKKDLLLYCTLC